MPAEKGWKLKISFEGPIPQSNFFAQDLSIARAGIMGFRGEMKRGLYSLEDHLSGLEDYPLTVLNPSALMKGKGV
jgi:hypothetical protein